MAMLKPAHRQDESVYMEKRVFEPSKDFVAKARLKRLEEYEDLYNRSIENPQEFWAGSGGKAGGGKAVSS